MSKKSGGGSATNSGIDYQQRVAACFQVFLYTQFDLSTVLHEDFTYIIKSIHFETDDAVDDLKLISNKNDTLYLQIKRKIELSDLSDSEFVKTLDQFIKQFGHNDPKAQFILVTSSDSSRKITGELRKILSQIRLNDTSFGLNPLNKNEEELFQKFRSAFFSRSKVLLGHQPPDPAFIRFAKQVHVEVMDVENGMPLEKSVKLLLSGQVQNPKLVWSLLIKNSLTYAADRASINKSALGKVLNNYRLRKNAPAVDKEFEELLRDSISLTGEYSCYKEVLVLNRENEEENHILEFPRFSDTCTKLLSFSGNKVTIDGVPEPITVIFRGSSGKGLERFIEQDPHALGDKKIVIFNAPEISKNGLEECIGLYQEYLEQLVSENKNVGSCLHCGKPVGRSENLLIEIDDKDTPSAVGACHITCRRPMDRVLGTVHIEGGNLSPYLEQFDFKEWVTLSLKGGILVSGLAPGMQGYATIAWSGYQQQPEGDYCVKFELEDGTRRFGFHRGKIERIPQQQAIDQATAFNLRLKEHKAENDPIGFTTKNVTYGVYSKILPYLETDDEFVAITQAKAVRYSQQEAKLHESGRMYYAPMCYVVDKHQGTILNIGNMVPLISDPKKIDLLAGSWKKAGIDVADLTLRIIKSDQEADVMFGRLFADGMLLVLDPLLDPKGKLLGGYLVRPAMDIANEMEEKKNDSASGTLRAVSDPTWFKDDLIRVVLQGDTGAQTLYGRLVRDETENESGIRCVIMRPMDDDEFPDNVDLVIPSQLVSPWDGVDMS